MLKSDGFQSTAEIDARLAELEQEKKQLLALREQLLQPPSNIFDSPLYSPEQKIAIFRGLFRGRADIFAKRGQNKQGRSGYSVAHKRKPTNASLSPLNIKRMFTKNTLSDGLR